MANTTTGGTGGTGANGAGGIGGSKSNVDLGDNKLKSDEGDDVQLPSIPKNAAGFYDPDHAAPGDYNVPPSFGPSAGAGMPAASKETNPDQGSGKSEDEKVEKTDGKVEGNKKDVKDAATTSADKEALEDNVPKEPVHGDAGKTGGVTPGQKAASVSPDPIKGQGK